MCGHAPSNTRPSSAHVDEAEATVAHLLMRSATWFASRGHQTATTEMWFVAASAKSSRIIWATEGEAAFPLLMQNALPLWSITRSTERPQSWGRKMLEPVEGGGHLPPVRA